MVSLDDMVLFVEVARILSFSKAADSLDIPASTLSRRIAALEKSIGLRLINRTTRHLRLTEAGQLYYERTEPIVEQAKQVHLQLVGLLSEPSGMLRVSLPIDFSIAYLTPLIVKFSHEYPKVNFEFDVTPKRIDLVSDPWDLAIRMGIQPSSGLIARHLVSISRYLYASPTYLKKYGLPERPEDLSSHRCLKMNTPQESKGWTLHHGDDSFVVNFESKYSVNNIGVLKSFATMGEGIVLLSVGVAKKEVDEGELVRVLPLWAAAPIPVYALTETRLIPLKVLYFIDFLRAQFQKESFLLSGVVEL